MGRPRKPTNLKVLDGTFREDRHGKLDAEVQPIGLEVLPVAPDYLLDSGKETWNRIGQMLLDLHLLTTVDIDALEIYCDAWDELDRCDADIARDGRMQVTKEGRIVAHPSLKLKDAAFSRIKTFHASFGMTASARVGLKIDRPKETGVARRKRG